MEFITSMELVQIVETVTIVHMFVQMDVIGKLHHVMIKKMLKI